MVIVYVVVLAHFHSFILGTLFHVYISTYMYNLSIICEKNSYFSLKVTI